MRSRRLPQAVILLGVTSFFADVGSEMIFPLLPAFVTGLGASAAFLGLMEGLADATASVLKLASGYLADHTRRSKLLVVFGYGVAAAVRPLVGAATAPWHVLAVRVTDRVGKGARSSPRDVLISGSVPTDQIGRAFGYHRAMDHAGAVVGPLVATVLLHAGFETRSVFWMALLPGLLSVIAVLAVREPPLVSRTTASLGPPLGRHLPGRLKAYLAILAWFSLGNSSDVFLLLRAKDVGVPAASLPLLWAVFHVSKLGSSYLGGSWSDRLPRRSLIVSGWAVYAATYIAFGLAQQAWQAWGLFIIYGTYYGLTEPAEKALVRDLAPIDTRGRAFGAYNFITGVSAIPAGLLTGWLWQTWSPFVAFAVGATFALTASMALMLWSSRGEPERLVTL